MPVTCPLCSNSSSSFYKSEKQHFYLCDTCKGIFADPKLHLNSKEEKERYLHHKNNIHDLGYIKFADPIISTVKKHYDHKDKGLDFGCGHTPVISEVLKAEGYQVALYDPLFFDQQEVLNSTYDYISSCEVIEHFSHPDREFKLLYDLLIPQGKLICMTFIYTTSIDFENWFYKNDPTHVFMYQKETLQWIKAYFGFSNVEVQNRLIIFTK